jgi:hypothetical protein
MHPHQHFLIAVYWRLDVPQFLTADMKISPWAAS